MRQKKEKKPENSERWLLTYSDLMNLLLILFILLYSMSNVDVVKYEELAKSLNGALGGTGSSVLNGNNGALNGQIGVLDGGTQIDGTPETTPPAEESSTEESTSSEASVETSKDDSTDSSEHPSNGIYTPEDMEALKHKVDQILAEYNQNGSITTNISEKGLTISFADDVFFDSGQDQLKDKMKMGLKAIALMLGRVDNSLLVEGHTDNIPISNPKFSSNWQLSALRSANVVQYLMEDGQVDKERLSAIGYGDTRPIASNDTEEGRSRNRRIDLVVIYDLK